MWSRQLITTKDALAQLDEIWRWNVDHYGRDHAHNYIEKLNDFIEKSIFPSPDKGRLLPDLKKPAYYRNFKKTGFSHGHVIVYSFDLQTVVITNIFHTAQNWVTQLRKKRDK